MPYQGAADCLYRVIREEGFLHLYAGLRLACVISPHQLCVLLLPPGIEPALWQYTNVAWDVRRRGCSGNRAPD